MIKLTYALVRLPHLSREAFQTYWFETHAPLVASVRLNGSERSAGRLCSCT